MKHRLLLGLTVTFGLVACEGNTTSLGGPEGDQASASSEGPPAKTGTKSADEPISDSESDGGSGTPVPPGPPVAVGADPDGGCSSGTLTAHGYSWLPIPTEAPCEYLLPHYPDDWAPGANTQLDPATWDPEYVYINVFGGGVNEYAAYKESVEGCDGDSQHGWYYDSRMDGEIPTRVMKMCPMTCDLAANLPYVRLNSNYRWCH